MNVEVFDLSLRKLLKKVGIIGQREKAVGWWEETSV
jgi:hypothetical protein